MIEIEREWIHKKIRESRTTLIYGSSGSGKTTYVNQLSNKISTNKINKNNNNSLIEYLDYINKPNIDDTYIKQLKQRINSIFDNKQPSPCYIIIDSIDILIDNDKSFLLYLKTKFNSINKLNNNKNSTIKIILTCRNECLYRIKTQLKFDSLITLDYTDTTQPPPPFNIHTKNSILFQTNINNNNNSYLMSDAYKHLDNRLSCNSYLSTLIMNECEINNNKRVKQKIILKSNCNLLYLDMLCNLLLFNVVDIRSINKVPSTLNGIYLYVCEYLYAYFKTTDYANMQEPSNMTHLQLLPYSNTTITSSSWSYHRAINTTQQNNDTKLIDDTRTSTVVHENNASSKSSEKSDLDSNNNNIDDEDFNLFRAILSLFVVIKMQPLSKLQIHERILSSIRYENLDETTFNELFNLLSALLFRVVTYDSTTTTTNRQQQVKQVNLSSSHRYTLIHSSLYEFLNDVKFCTCRHLANCYEAHAMLATYSFRQLVNIKHLETIDYKIYREYLANFKRHLTSTSPKYLLETIDYLRDYVSVSSTSSSPPPSSSTSSNQVVTCPINNDANSVIIESNKPSIETAPSSANNSNIPRNNRRRTKWLKYFCCSGKR